MIVTSVQNIELIMAKEGVLSPAERVVKGHWSPRLAGNEVSIGKQLSFVTWSICVAYQLLHRTYIEPTDRKIIS
jgi:hypothetical protein